MHILLLYSEYNITFICSEYITFCILVNIYILPLYSEYAVQVLPIYIYYSEYITYIVNILLLYHLYRGTVK